MMKVQNLKVNVKRMDILAALNENRENHLVEYDNAMTEYRNQIAEIADQIHREALNDDVEVPKNGWQVKLHRPVLIIEEYDKYIKMFELSSDEEIQIDTYMYDCFFDDKWDLAERAKLVNSSYIGS